MMCTVDQDIWELKLSKETVELETQMRIDGLKGEENEFGAICYVVPIN